ncbi:MAG TPA: hypothetical protein VGD74_02165, partial [Vulgatibacter sp.]
CVCYEYESTDKTEPRLLGVAVERVDDFFADSGSKRNVHAIVYRLAGTKQMVYVVDPTKPDLLLNRVETGTSMTDDEWRLSPGMSLVQWPGNVGTQVERKQMATRYQNGLQVGEPEEVTIQTFFSDTVQIPASLDGGESQVFEATRIEYVGTPWDEPRRWFVPGVGNVQLELELTTMAKKKTTWRLRNVRELDRETCPGPSPKDPCGRTQDD